MRRYSRLGTLTKCSVKSILDSHRNSIMMLDLKFSIAAVSIATGTYVAGLYGMNLINGLEDATNGFAAITTGSIVGSIGAALFGALMLRRIKKIYHLRSVRKR